MNRHGQTIYTTSLIILGILIFVQINQAESSSTLLHSVRLQSDVTHKQGLTSYSDAASYDLESNEVRFDAKELLIKNSENWLFIAVRVEDSDANKEEGLIILIDANHDQTWAEDAKIIYVSSSRASDDGFFSGDSAIGYQETSEIKFIGAVSSFIYGPTGTSQRLYEFKIPLQTPYPTKDISVYDPDGFMLGLDIVLMYDSTDFVSWNSGNTSLTADASNYQSLVLAGPGRYLIPEFEPDVTTIITETEAETDTEPEIPAAQGAAGVSGYDFIGFLGAIIILGVSISYRRRLKQ